MSLLSRLPTIRGTYRENAELSKMNWFQVGGPAEILFRPADAEDLAQFFREKPDDVPVIVLGVGSNLIVRDGGIRGVVIRLGKGFAQIHAQSETIEAGAGSLCFNVAQLAKQYAIAGLEFLCGIPGTMGGAAAMNAGAYGADMAAIVKEIEAVDEAGTIHRIPVTDIGYVYRGTTLPEDMIITRVWIEGARGNRAEIETRMEEISAKRESTQPLRNRTGGSTFKNPPGYKAWELIDQAGCRGLKRGGAQISELHCNFMLNTGGATAEDIEQLGEEVRRRVYETSGIELEWEIKRIGNKI